MDIKEEKEEIIDDDARYKPNYKVFKTTSSVSPHPAASTTNFKEVTADDHTQQLDVNEVKELLTSQLKEELDESNQAIVITTQDSLIKEEESFVDDPDDPKFQSFIIKEVEPVVAVIKQEEELCIEDIQRELKSTSGKATVQCEICNKVISSSKNLQRHKRTHQKPKCKKIGKVSVKNSIHKCGDKRNALLICDHCGYSHTVKRSLKEHILIHSTQIVECEICHSRIKISNMKKHMSRSHRQITFECKICNRSFKNRNLLTRHEKYHNQARLTCKFCDRKFTEQGFLNSHMKFHENPEQFQCQICGHQSKTTASLNTHMKVHMENRAKPFECNQCEYKADKKGRLKDHMKQHDDHGHEMFADYIQCEECNTILKDEIKYKIHLKKKHGVV